MKGVRKSMREASLCLLVIFSLMSMVVSSGCKDEVVSDSSDIVFPTNNVSYSQHVQPLFNQTCALSACHDNGQHSSDLCLTSYNNTVFRTPGVVVPGQPQVSTIVFRIEGTTGQQMPLNRAPLNQNQINGIRTWIAEGAKDN